MSTYHDGQRHSQPGSGTCALVMSTGEGWYAAVTQAAGSKLRSEREEKSGMPQKKEPRWFS